MKVTSDDFDTAKEVLRSEVVPRVARAPGFVAGYWLEPEGDKGMSIVVFESEDAARTAAEQLRPPPMVEVERVDVREVIAHA